MTSSVDLMIESGSYQVMGMDASDGSVSANVMLGVGIEPTYTLDVFGDMRV